MLILPIKKQWYDMILSGEKREEYREIKSYYSSRFKNIGLLDENNIPTGKAKIIAFRNGYAESSSIFRAMCSLSIKTGNTLWGAEKDKLYYVLNIEVLL